MQELHVVSQKNEANFSCPCCRVWSLCDINYMSIPKSAVTSEYLNTRTYMLVCRACGKGSVWKQFDRKDNYNYRLKLVDPSVSNAPRPSPDMPEDVLKEYEEARLVVNQSPRAAAAFLRLALQKLCKHLGEPGKNIDTDIRSLAKRPEIGERFIRAADTLRIVGNNAVHPGEMNDQDIDNVSNGLFELLNLLVSCAITQPNKWDSIYNGLPEGARTSAEDKDGRNKT